MRKEKQRKREREREGEREREREGDSSKGTGKTKLLTPEKKLPDTNKTLRAVREDGVLSAGRHQQTIEGSKGGWYP